MARGPDGRYAFIIPVLPSGSQLHNSILVKNYPQHKVAVCVEKHGSELNVAIMDPEPLSNAFDIHPDHLATSTHDPWEGYEREGAFSSNELVLRAIKPAAAVCTTHVYLAKPRREMAFGCGVFAIYDAQTYLQDQDFFRRISVSADVHPLPGTPIADWRTIDVFPPEYMIGAQSITTLRAYEQATPGIAHQQFVTKAKTLKDYATKYHRWLEAHEFNQYIMWKSFLMVHSAVEAVRTMSPEEVQRRIGEHLLSRESVE